MKEVHLLDITALISQATVLVATWSLGSNLQGTILLGDCIFVQSLSLADDGSDIWEDVVCHHCA
jgi:hypothetical protein